MLFLRPYVTYISTAKYYYFTINQDEAADSHDIAFIQTSFELIYQSTIWGANTSIPRWWYEKPPMANIYTFRANPQTLTHHLSLI